MCFDPLAMFIFMVGHQISTHFHMSKQHNWAQIPNGVDEQKKPGFPWEEPNDHRGCNQIHQENAEIVVAIDGTWTRIQCSSRCSQKGYKSRSTMCSTSPDSGDKSQLSLFQFGHGGKIRHGVSRGLLWTLTKI